MARREERAYREYVSDEQRSQPGCPARDLCDESLLRDTSSRASRGTTCEFVAFFADGADRTTLERVATEGVDPDASSVRRLSRRGGRCGGTPVWRSEADRRSGSRRVIVQGAPD